MEKFTKHQFNIFQNPKNNYSRSFADSCKIMQIGALSGAIVGIPPGKAWKNHPGNPNEAVQKYANEYLFATVGFDTAENEPRQVPCKIAAREL